MNVSRRRAIHIGALSLAGSAAFASIGTRTGLAASIESAEEQVTVQAVSGEVSELHVSELDLSLEWKGIDTEDSFVDFELFVRVNDGDRTSVATGSVDLGGRTAGGGTITRDDDAPTWDSTSWDAAEGVSSINLLSAVDGGLTAEDGPYNLVFDLVFEHPTTGAQTNASTGIEVAVQAVMPDSALLREENYPTEYRAEWESGYSGQTDIAWSEDGVMFEGRKYDWNHGVIWFANPTPIDITKYNELSFESEVTRIDKGPAQFGIYGPDRYSEVASVNDNRVYPSYYPDGDTSVTPAASSIRVDSTYNRQWKTLDLTQWHDEPAFEDGAYIGFGMNSGTGGDENMGWMTCHLYDIELV